MSLPVRTIAWCNYKYYGILAFYTTNVSI
jgi:hypothetical protein